MNDITALPSAIATRIALNPLHSFAAAFLCFCRQNAVDNKVCGLNGAARYVSTRINRLHSSELTLRPAKPMTALMPFKAGSAAFLSSTSSNQATTMKSPALIAGNPGTPPPMKLAPRNVPLPSQEGKQGAIQYALYVTTVIIYAG